MVNIGIILNMRLQINSHNLPYAKKNIFFRTKNNQIKSKQSKKGNKNTRHTKQQRIARNRIESRRGQIDIFIRTVYFSVTYDVAL